MKYWLSPPRKARRVTVTSVNSLGSHPSSLLKVTVTSAIPVGALPVPPAKMTSSVFFERSALELVSPSTQRTASEMLDLPEPLGPTTAVIPGSKANTVRMAKLLNPCRSSRESRGIGESGAAARWVMRVGRFMGTRRGASGE